MLDRPLLATIDYRHRSANRKCAQASLQQCLLHLYHARQSIDQRHEIRSPNPSTRVRCKRQYSIRHVSHQQTRLTGGAFTDSVVYNKTTGLFTYGNLLTSSLNRCINVNCALPGETDIVDSGCFTAVGVFSIDYDAPVGRDQGMFRQALSPLVVYQDKGEDDGEDER